MQIGISNETRGGRRYIPYVFTEHGVGMLSSVLNSQRAVQMNIAIIRAFIGLREVLASHKDLAREFERLAHTRQEHAAVLSIVVKDIQDLKTTVIQKFKEPDGSPRPQAPHRFHRRPKVNRQSMRDPLLPPLAAIAAGILSSRFVSFGIRELLAVIALFAALGAIALWRQARALAGACCLLGFMSAGALTDLAHRPGPRPELDAEGRDPVILSGCVVQPPALSGDRERFLVELDPGARVQVTAYAREGHPPPALRYGQRVEFEARVRRPRNYGNPGSFDYARYLARRDIYWTASTSTGAEITVLPGECGSRFQAAIMGLRVMALDRLAQLYNGKPYETGMMQAVMIGETYQDRARVDGAVPQHRHLPRAGDLRHAYGCVSRIS